MNLNEFNEMVATILKENKIDADLLQQNANLPKGGEQISLQIMLKAGMAKKHALIAIYGPLEQGQAANELSDISNFGEMYDTCCVRYSIALAEKWVKKDYWCEVGMKYPDFTVSKFLEKWGLTYSSDIEKYGRMMYEVWENEARTMACSFEKGRMGKGGYAGMVFNNFDKAVAFVDWYLAQPEFYVKDVDVFINGLGGINIQDYKNLNAIFP